MDLSQSLPLCTYFSQLHFSHYHAILLWLSASLLSLALLIVFISLLGSILTPLNARALINQCRVVLFHRDPKLLVSSLSSSILSVAAAHPSVSAHGMPVCMQSPLQNLCLVNRMWGWGKAGWWCMEVLSLIGLHASRNTLFFLFYMTHYTSLRSTSVSQLYWPDSSWTGMRDTYMYVCIFFVGYGGVVLHGADTFRVMQTIWKCVFLCRVTNESEGVSRSSVTGWVRLGIF